MQRKHWQFLRKYRNVNRNETSDDNSISHFFKKSTILRFYSSTMRISKGKILPRVLLFTVVSLSSSLLIMIVLFFCKLVIKRFFIHQRIVSFLLIQLVLLAILTRRTKDVVSKKHSGVLRTENELLLPALYDNQH
jgi:hypothetical protein